MNEETKTSLEDRVRKLENTSSWLTKAGGIITVVIAIVAGVSITSFPDFVKKKQH